MRYVGYLGAQSKRLVRIKGAVAGGAERLHMVDGIASVTIQRDVDGLEKRVRENFLVPPKLKLLCVRYLRDRTFGSLSERIVNHLLGDRRGGDSHDCHECADNGDIPICMISRRCLGSLRA